MKSFAERNTLAIGAIGCALTAAIVLGALNYDRLPLVNNDVGYSAYFAEAGGLNPGADVQVAGLIVGKVTDVTLDGARVLVTFKVGGDIPVGDRSEAHVKARSLLGAKILEITPRGAGRQTGPIPLDRTHPAYQLPDALGDLTSAISGLDTNQLSTSLSTLAETFQDSPAQVRIAVAGVGRLAQSLDERDQQLRDLLTNSHKVTDVLAHRSDKLVSLVADANALLVYLQNQSRALDEISRDISAVTTQLKGFIDDNNQTFKPALEKLNGALTIVDNRKKEVQKSLVLLNKYAMSLGESVASGPFFKAYVGNLLPGQFLQPFIDVAFSDLGLDPNVLLPSQLHDPQTGQPAMSALPAPYPRTGQGGEPALHLPDAITGKPGDPRYPYREPLPAPPPGGPPPGPPSLEGPGAPQPPATDVPPVAAQAGGEG